MGSGSEGVQWPRIEGIFVLSVVNSMRKTRKHLFLAEDRKGGKKAYNSRKNKWKKQSLRGKEGG